jgi:hypothetical protein
MVNLERSLHDRPRPFYALYHNPLLEHVLSKCGGLSKLGGTNQYRVYGNDTIA